MPEKEGKERLHQFEEGHKFFLHELIDTCCWNLSQNKITILNTSKNDPITLISLCNFDLSEPHFYIIKLAF